MIDWAIAGSLLASISRRQSALETDAERLCREFPRFQNIDYPLTLLPITVAASHLDNHRSVVEHYVACLERVISHYLSSADVRAYFALSPEEENLVRADTSLKPAIRIARLDGYINQADGKLRILENNSDCPAGILFTERINLLTDRLLERVNAESGVALVKMPLDERDCARQEMLAAYRQQGGDKKNPTIAILQIKGRSNLESIEMAKEFCARGTQTFVADPREVSVSADGVRMEGREVDLIWNKVNTVYWNNLVAETPGLLGRWAEAISSRRVCHINPFASRYVTESKLCAAFMQEPEFAHHFEPAEREFLKEVLPWSRKLKEGKEVEYKGKSWEMSELLRERQFDFVLKQPYDIRGDGVTIGRSVTRSEWEEALKRAVSEGNTAQEFINGQSYPVMTGARETQVTPMTASFDSFMFGGRLCGLGAKASLKHKVNLFQGGRKLAVRVYAWKEKAAV